MTALRTTARRQLHVVATVAQVEIIASAYRSRKIVEKTHNCGKSVSENSSKHVAVLALILSLYPNFANFLVMHMLHSDLLHNKRWNVKIEFIYF